MNIDMYLCILLADICVVYYWMNVYHLWCASMEIITQIQMYLFLCPCISIPLHPPSYNIVRSGFCLTMLFNIVILCLIVYNGH